MARFERQQIRERLYRNRFLVPNAVTVGNMFCGFLAIFYASSGKIQNAVIYICVAIILDGVDGRVARKLNATSPFGLEFDSLSDVISFGVAPAVLAYHWGLKSVADEIGILFCFAFTLCAATRLARFNILDSSIKGFSGLPTPGAAAAVATLINLKINHTPNILTASLFGSFMLLMSYLMISQIEFASIKQVTLKDMRVRGRVLVGTLIALLWYSPKVGLAIVAFAYVLSGPGISIINLFRGTKKISSSSHTASEEGVQMQSPSKMTIQEEELH